MTPTRLWLQSSKSSDVFVPGTETKTGDRAFWVAGLHAWNSLPVKHPRSGLLCKSSYLH